MAARQAAAHLPMHNLPAFAVVSAYMPQGSEFDPWPVARRLAATGALIALPVTPRAGDTMIFRQYSARETLMPDAAGIPAPPPHAPQIHPDLVLCPLLGFDAAGGRLGQGAGHYDRALAALRARRRVFVLGLGFSVQQADDLPTSEFDQPMDAILTETGYIAVR